MPSETQVAKWGNSLAIRIPRGVAQEARLSEGVRMTFEVNSEGDLVLRAVRRRYELSELVAGITRGNRHGETDWGAAVGEESWG